MSSVDNQPGNVNKEIQLENGLDALKFGTKEKREEEKFSVLSFQILIRILIGFNCKCSEQRPTTY